MNTYLGDHTVFFTYDAMNLLHDMNEFESIKIYNENTEIVLVPFKINLNGKMPFNTIMLFNEYNGCLNFTSMRTNCESIENKEMLLSSVQCYLYTILNSSNSVSMDFDEIVGNVDFKGLYFYQEKMYVFIDLTKLSVNTTLINKDEVYWFALIDEIANKKNVCNIKIDDAVVDFFLQNNEFMFFKDGYQKQIEIPTVVYTGKQENKLFFNYIFGNVPLDKNAILGAGFYFTDYNNSIREICSSINSDTLGNVGIIRYALFLGNNLVKLNYPNDMTDMSEIKQIKIDAEETANSNTNANYIYEKMTLRISDHDGSWKEKYDSVFLGKIELDNGEFLKNAPMYVCKDYYSHLPLSYHYIDTYTIRDLLNEKGTYQIK